MSERDFKAELLEKLRSEKDQDKKVLGVGTKSYSFKEMAQEVESDSQFGLKLVELSKRVELRDFNFSRE